MKSILITGCNRGLGLGLVRQLTRLQRPPKHIFATCRNIDEAPELRDVVDNNPSVNIHLIELDVRDVDAHAGAVDYVRQTVRHDGLNVLVNNAGVGGRSVRLAATKELDVLDTFRVNACAPVMLTKSFLPLLKSAAAAQPTAEPGIQRAVVINMSSVLGSIGGNTDGAMFAYRMSKAALNAATKSMSVEFAADGLLCVCMHPGWVRTRLGGNKAPLEVADAMAQLWQTVQALGAQQNGAFLDYRGERIEW